MRALAIGRKRLGGLQEECNGGEGSRRAERRHLKARVVLACSVLMARQTRSSVLTMPLAPSSGSRRRRHVHYERTVRLHQHGVRWRMGR
jgi:hypothetical protein